MNHLDIVQEALNRFASPNVDAGEEGKAQLTRLAGHLMKERGINAFLFKKDPPGNQVNGRSVDLIILPDEGKHVDVATDVKDGSGGFIIQAQWIEYALDGNTSNRDRYITPTAQIAAEPGPMQLSQSVPPDEEPAPGGDVPDPSAFVQLIAAAVVQQLQPTLDKLAAKRTFKGNLTGQLPLLGRVNVPIELKEQ